MKIKLALPKGRLMLEIANLLQDAGWELRGYDEESRFYRPESARYPDLQMKVFHEKDVPIQVAIGNYDLGICGRDWTEELLARYPGSALVKVKELGRERSTLHVAASRTTDVGGILAGQKTVRIVSEYPNLAESFAVRQRLRRFSVFPVWGATEVYPPESADLALISVRTEEELAGYGLVSVCEILSSGAFLVANRSSWESKDMRDVLASIYDNVDADETHPATTGKMKISSSPARRHMESEGDDTVWFALPDGHQQEPTVDFLKRAGIQITDYPSSSGNRRPALSLDGVEVKVIRPQDMPLQVANGNFDLAVTGQDWLREHQYQFPTSPARELMKLNFGRVKIVAVVSEHLAVNDTSGLKQLSSERRTPLRVASEYVNIADGYARDNHFGWYRVVPTWGASEGFLPEDADWLIENTQTGRTLSRHNLKIIDTLFESTACLVGRSDSTYSRSKKERIKSIIATLKAAGEG